MGIEAGIMVPHPPLIIPEVGKGGEKTISKTAAAYERAASFIAGSAPETLVVISPPAAVYRDYFHVSPGARASGSFANFGAPRAAVSVDYDAEFVSGLETLAEAGGLPAGTLGERLGELDHATLVPLYFLEKTCGAIKAKVVRVAGGRR